MGSWKCPLPGPGHLLRGPGASLRGPGWLWTGSRPRSSMTALGAGDRVYASPGNTSALCSIQYFLRVHG